MLPFPGMDPFVEGQFWSSFHAQLCVEFVRQLAPKLRGRYAALVEERAITESMDDLAILRRDIRPDVSVVSKRGIEKPGGTATVERAPIQMHASYTAQGSMHFVEIRSVRGLELITLIEVLSPANKRGEGRNEYLLKRSDVLRSSVNLVEIDLLLSGQRPPMIEAFPETHYVAIVHRAISRPLADVWPVNLDEKLPVLPIPLSNGDEDVYVDLQKAVHSVLTDSGLYELIDYTLPLHAPLKTEELAWIEDQIQSVRR